MIRHLLRMVTAAAILFSAHPVTAAWLKARSKHFVIYSQGTEASLRTFATQVEELDTALRLLSGTPERGASNPIRSPYSSCATWMRYG